VCCSANRSTSSVSKPSRRGRNRRGQALVEFAVVSLVLYMLLAAILTFGQILYSAQGLQQAVDVAARELSRTPLPADIKFQDDNNPATDVLHNSTVQSRIFDERYLVLSIDAGSNPMTFNGGHTIGDFPLVNQQLLPLMVYETGLTEVQVNPLGGIQPIQYFPGPSSQIGGYLRYPGAVFMDPNPDPTLSPPASGFLVRIPVVSPINPNPAPVTQSIVRWVSVLEEINSTANVQNNLSGFQVSSPERGVVALRINYPYQSATMSGYQPPAVPLTPTSPTNPVVPIPADDAISGGSLPPDVGNPVVSAWASGPSSGLYGLGKQGAWAKIVRPYRSLISAQAIYRREVFSSQ
jgi:Flp pilus assembly protein TadG